MPALAWIVASGVLMSLISLVGAVTAPSSDATIQRLTLPLFSLSACTLMGGAFLQPERSSTARAARSAAPSRNTGHVVAVCGRRSPASKTARHADPDHRGESGPALRHRRSRR